MALWGFQAMLSAWSEPCMTCLWAGLSRAAAPQQPSTWCHSPWRWQTSLTSAKGSYAPRTVVPAVVPTKNGSCKHIRQLAVVQP